MRVVLVFIGFLLLFVGGCSLVALRQDREHRDLATTYIVCGALAFALSRVLPKA